MANKFPFENKMRSALFVLLINFLLTIVIVIAGQIGNSLGIKDALIPISVVWPATGISLAALLLFGYKTWPAIFIGNLISNLISFYTGSITYLAPGLVALTSSLGSTAEALIACYIMNKYCTRGYFNTTKDILIFLIPAGLVASFVAASVGVTALFVYDPSIQLTQYFYMFTTFWVGDSMGMYILTPLIVVWTLSESFVKLRQFSFEVLLMVLGFSIVTFLLLKFGLPVAHFYIPLCLWVTYRFRMHGATLAIFFIALATIVPTSMNHGAFVSYFPGFSLLILVTFLQMIIISSLLLAAIINEREAAWYKLRNYNISLENVFFSSHMDSNKIFQILVKEKLATLLTCGLARRIHVHLRKFDQSVHSSLIFLKEFENFLNINKERLDPNIINDLHHNLKTLGYHLAEITKYKSQAFKITNFIQENSFVGLQDKVNVKCVNINTMLERCLLNATAEKVKEDPNFKFSCLSVLDQNMGLAIPEEFAHTFTFLLMISIESLYQKMIRVDYKPTLQIVTKNHPSKVVISISDNGKGISSEQLSYLLKSPQKIAKIEDVTNFGFKLVHDIISYVYHGEITAELNPDEGEKFILTIPKDNPETFSDKIPA